MKEKLKRSFKIILCLVMVFTAMPEFRLQAASHTNIKSSKVLQPNKTYYYDLNGDGKDESIYFTQTDKNEDNVQIELYVNNKKVLSKTEEINAIVKLSNLNQKDKYIEFEIAFQGEDAMITFLGFYRYKNSKLTKMFTTNGQKSYNGLNLYRYDGVRTGKNGTFYIKSDTPFSISAMGCYYCYMPFKIKGDKITAKKVKNYETFSPFVSASGRTKAMQFKANKELKAYTKASTSSKKAFTIKKGEKLTITKIHPVSFKEDKKSAFVYVKKGTKKGWIYLKNANYDYGNPVFEQTPAWG